MQKITTLDEHQTQTQQRARPPALKIHNTQFLVREHIKEVNKAPERNSI
jgi:hypothetical protein